MSAPPGAFNATGIPVSPDFVYEILLSIPHFQKIPFLNKMKNELLFIPSVSQKYPHR